MIALVYKWSRKDFLLECSLLESSLHRNFTEASLSNVPKSSVSCATLFTITSETFLKLKSMISANCIQVFTYH